MASGNGDGTDINDSDNQVPRSAAGGVLTACYGQASGVIYGITGDGFLFTSDRPDLLLES